MKTRQKMLYAAIVTFLCIPVLFSLAYGKGNSNNQNKNVYCCANGNVDHMTSEQCAKKGGKPFGSKSVALKKCNTINNQVQSSQGKKQKQSKPAPVHCCVEGDVEEMSSSDCRKKGGKGYTTALVAKLKCRQAQVHCCFGQTITEMEVDVCRMKGGKPYQTKAEASRRCKEPDVVCCIKGKVKTVSERVCRGNGGKKYKTAAEARRNCGWRCDRGQVRLAGLKGEASGKLKLYKTKTQALQACRKMVEKGYCCTKEGIVLKSRNECKQPERFFTAQRTAEKYCPKKNGKQETTVKISDPVEISTGLSKRLKKIDGKLPGRKFAAINGTVLARGRMKGEEHGIVVSQPNSDANRFPPVPGGRLLVRYYFTDLSIPFPELVSVTLNNSGNRRNWELGREVPISGTDIIVSIPEDIPQEPGYTVTVRAIGEPPGITSRYGVSDPFTIAFPTTGGGETCEDCLFVVSPNGGERWQEGTRQTISWRYSGHTLPETWEVAILRGDVTYVTAARSDTDCNPETGVCSIIRPVLLADSINIANNCRVRVSGGGLSDSSNNPFTIYRPSIELLYPETDVRHVFTLGQEVAVTWRIVGEFPGAVRVKLLKNGSEVETLATVRSDRIGSLWQVGGALDGADDCSRWSRLAGSGYQIRIESTEEPEQFNSTSDMFEIRRPQMSISAPSGGEVLRIDERYTIRWDPAGIGGTVRIAIQYGDMGRPSDTDTLAINQPNDGSFTWVVGQTGRGESRGDHGDMGPGVGTMGSPPARIGSSARIWITSEQCERIYSISPGNFEVVR